MSIAIAAIGTEEDLCVLVEVANPNPRPLRVSALEIQEEGGRRFAVATPGSDKGLPCLLNETEKAHYWASAPQLGNIMVESGYGRKRRIKALITDSYDKKHVSEWMEFDAAHWKARMKTV